MCNISFRSSVVIECLIKHVLFCEAQWVYPTHTNLISDDEISRTYCFSYLHLSNSSTSLQMKTKQAGGYLGDILPQGWEPMTTSPVSSCVGCRRLPTQCVWGWGQKFRPTTNMFVSGARWKPSPRCHSGGGRTWRGCAGRRCGGRPCLSNQTMTDKNSFMKSVEHADGTPTSQGTRHFPECLIFFAVF